MTTHPEQSRKCCNCMWWEHIEDIVTESLGKCRGAPPQPPPNGGSFGFPLDGYCLWPVSRGEDWCGSFRMKEPGQ